MTDNKRFSPFPEIYTERLFLRELGPRDAAEIFLLRSDERVLEYLDRQPSQNIIEAGKFIEKIVTSINNDECIYWALSLKNHSRLIGTICLWNFSPDNTKADLGYELLPEHQGKGYITEAIRAVLHYGFNNLQLSVIDAEVDPQNIKSVKLLNKFRFRLTVNPGENIDNEGNVIPTVIYSLERDFYNNYSDEILS